MSATAQWDGSGTQEDLLVPRRVHPRGASHRRRQLEENPSSIAEACRSTRAPVLRSFAHPRPSLSARARSPQDEKGNIIGHDSKYATHRFVPDQPRGITAPRLQRLPVRQGQQAPPPAARGVEDYVPIALDQHVLLTPVRLRAHGSGQRRGHRLRSRPRRQATPSKAPARLGIPRTGARRRVQVPHPPALLRRGRVRGEPGDEWRAVGEHEMDYILFIKPDGPVTVAANPEEIDDARWVTGKNCER